MLDDIKYSDFKEMMWEYEREFNIEGLLTERSRVRKFLEETAYPGIISAEKKKANSILQNEE